MIFPTLSLRSSSDPEDALGRIDRAIHDRHHRLSAGISISSRFDTVQGALVVSQGSGKYLQVRHIAASSTPIPQSIRAECQKVAEGQLRDSALISQLISDLAEPQATVIEQLKCQAGKYVDRVLAVAVCDPGVWDQDFDGRISYAPFCDATRLAELSGVTVIDAFPARDLAVGGNGRRLESLPYWMMFGDRSPKVAAQSRLLVSIEDRSTSYFLPASDGLDSDLPRIVVSESIGVGFLRELIRRHLPESQVPSEFDRIYADGRQVPMLREQWESVLRERQRSTSGSAFNSRLASGQASAPGDLELNGRLAEAVESYMQENVDGICNVLRTGIHWIVDQCLEQVSDRFGVEPVDLLVSCPARFNAGCINQLTQLLTNTNVMTTGQAGIERGKMAPVVAALLGLFHIDQMPANVPWLTGAGCQRILGRLTPGRPSNWRQLVRMMADYKPAPMKLKDAI